MSNITIDLNVNFPAEVIELFKRIGGSEASAPVAPVKSGAGRPPKEKASPAPVVTEPVESEGTMTLVELRELITPISDKSPALREQVKTIIKKHGAESLKVLEAKHYKSVLDKVMALNIEESSDL